MFDPVDPKVDYAFKYLFGREVGIPRLMNLIDSVLKPAPGQEIERLEIMNPFNPKESPEDKLTILDVKARDKSGRQFDVEMQMIAQRYYDKRIVYYASAFHQQQLKETQPYDVLHPTISISFIDFRMFDYPKQHHFHFRLLEKTELFPMTEDLEFHILQLPNFSKSADELEGGLDEWLYFLRHADKISEGQLPSALQKPLLIRAMEDLNMLTQTETEREQYQSRLKGIRDYNTNIIGREKDKEQAHAQGRVEGRVEGLRENTIRTIQNLDECLLQPKTPLSQLDPLSLEDLIEMSTQRFEQLLKRVPSN